MSNDGVEIDDYQDIEQQYKQQKQHATQQGQLSQEQRMKQELQNLPQGENLINWIAGHLRERLEGVPQVLWQYADQNAAQQQRSQLVSFINGQTNEVLVTTEVNRHEIARMRSMQDSWIVQLVSQIQGSGQQEHQSEMHERFENRMSEQYDEMMEKLTGSSNE